MTTPTTAAGDGGAPRRSNEERRERRDMFGFHPAILAMPAAMPRPLDDETTVPDPDAGEGRGR